MLFYLFIFWSWGAKTVTDAKLRGCIVVFFLRSQNHNFVKVRGLKLQLNLTFIDVVNM